MRKITSGLLLTLLTLVLSALTVTASADSLKTRQGTIVSVSSLPAACVSSVLRKDVVYLTAGTVGIYVCTAANTWTLSGGGASYPLLASNGTAAAPSYSFSGDPDTGMYHTAAANTIGFSANGVVVATLTTNLLQLGSAFKVQMGVSALSFPGVQGLRIDDADTGTGLTFSQSLFTVDHTITVPNVDGTMTVLGNTATGTGSVVRATAPTVSALIATGARINTSVTSGSGMQHVRGASCTTAVGINASCDTVITWPVAFADTNYTATATLDSPSGGLVFVLNTKTKTTTSITVTLVTLTAAASSGTINAIGMHD